VDSGHSCHEGVGPRIPWRCVTSRRAVDLSVARLDAGGLGSQRRDSWQVASLYLEQTKPVGPVAACGQHWYLGFGRLDRAEAYWSWVPGMAWLAAFLSARTDGVNPTALE